MNSDYDRNQWLREFMTLEEEFEYYNETLDRVILNPRFYLDNLEELDVFMVSFHDYNEKRRAKPKIKKTK